MLKSWSMDIKVDTSVAVVFDLDDTLYNEIEFLKSAFAGIAVSIDKLDWKLLYVRMLSLYRSGEDVFGYLAGHYPVEKGELLERYREHKPRIRPLEGAVDLLNAIKKQGGRTGILTDGRKRTQMNKIQALGVGDYIDEIVISEEIGSEKPDRRNYDCIAQKLGASRYFYVADNLRKDFVTPKAMGWTTIGLIDNGLNIHRDGFRYLEEKYRPGNFVASLSEILISA